nr:M28 family peptidase [Acidobacteriota bacterium]
MRLFRSRWNGLASIIGVVAVAGSVASVTARPGPPAADEARLRQALEVITPALPKAHVRFLSHDLLRGRDTGDVGFEIAREYVVGQFARIGLQPITGPSYLQEFDLLEAGADRGSELTVGATRLAKPDARFTPAWLTGRATWEGAGVFVGYGLATHGRDDYAGADVRGKAVFLLNGLPDNWSADRERARAAAARVEIARRKGAAVVVELTPHDRMPAGASAGTEPPRRVVVMADGSRPRLRVDAAVSGPAATALLDAWKWVAADGTTARDVGTVRLVRAHDIKRLKSWNVVGIIPGSDPARRNESVVFSSHLDHIGIVPPDANGDTICNGAHDNAIGTSQMLASAEALVRMRPPRTIVFAAVGAEERGLLGSWHYVRNPVMPIETTVANINLDGGREGTITDDVIDNAADLSDMARIVRQVMGAQGIGVTQDRSPAALVGFSSDHFSFLLAGIPTIDLKPGYSVNGDPQRGWTERMHYYETQRHKPADN